YISKNTIIPFLFDQAREACAIAFEGENSVWRLAQDDPDRYIYPAVRKGTELPLPDEIAVGLDDVSRRDKWNTPTPDEYALPTEIWRETVARRQRYEDVRAKLVNGEVTSINDFITYNLDIQQFAQDVIENCEGPELLRAFWKAINRVSVLDPTCGSGAFLFAALNILQPLYEACLERMRAFVADLGPDDHPQKYSDFKQILAQVAQHPNQTYYVLKSIVVNNLYGVDIMAEAVEIAKLRLFLKLVAQVERVEQIEPLPDIDFNIRAGNTLVGYTSKEEVRKAMQDKQLEGGIKQARILFGEEQAALAAIEGKAADIDRLFSRFKAMQTGGDLADFDAADF
ncbi:MAG: SAM-dependent methyltransferase, partial [Bacteroidetes bacterium]